MRNNLTKKSIQNSSYKPIFSTVKQYRSVMDEEDMINLNSMKKYTGCGRITVSSFFPCKKQSSV